jgi:hypothetical protein
MTPVLPIRLCAFAFAETGRGRLEGTESSALDATIARSSERTCFTLGGCYAF